MFVYMTGLPFFSSPCTQTEIYRSPFNVALSMTCGISWNSSFSFLSMGMAPVWVNMKFWFHMVLPGFFEWLDNRLVFPVFSVNHAITHIPPFLLVPRNLLGCAGFYHNSITVFQRKNAVVRKRPASKAAATWSGFSRSVAVRTRGLRPLGPKPLPVWMYVM